MKPDVSPPSQRPETSRIEIARVAYRVRGPSLPKLSPEGTSQIEKQVGAHLGTCSLSIATAESCTGGLLAVRLTENPGSSEYFLGSIIAYSNEIKTQLLGIDPGVLLEHGAVSEIVAEKMCEAVRERMDADLGLSITGIAGPTGGTEEKPIGTTFLGLCSPQGIETRHCVFAGSRHEIRVAATEEALRLLLDYCQHANR